jgi:hypothetical protein
MGVHHGRPFPYDFILTDLSPFPFRHDIDTLIAIIYSVKFGQLLFLMQYHSFNLYLHHFKHAYTF